MNFQIKAFDGDKTYSPRLDGHAFAENISLATHLVDTTRKVNHDTYVRDTLVEVLTKYLPIFHNSHDSKDEEDIWSVFERVLAKYPDSIFDGLPNDLAENHDLYLYGVRK